MTTKKDDGLFRSTYAIPTENKLSLDGLIKSLQLDSMADLLNMLATNEKQAHTTLENLAISYRQEKLNRRDLERKIRERQRLQAKLTALDAPKPDEQKP